jgi:hypothetical protein
MNDAFFFMPLGIFANSLTSSLGGFLEAKIGPRMYFKNKFRALIIGCSTITLSKVAIYFSKSLIIDYIAIFCFGIGAGINVQLKFKEVFSANKGSLEVLANP